MSNEILNSLIEEKCIFQFVTEEEVTKYNKENCVLGYMLQKDYLLEWRTTEDNIRLGLEISKQLTKEKKAQIDILLEQGLSMRKVANILEISHSTISRYKSGIYKKRKI